ncbi:MAG: molybdenum cofactor cytidylyltransferase [Pseudomonadota bacterium]
MVSGIILASGFSKRMRQEKLLLPVKNIPLIERVIRAAKQSFLHEIILIYQNEQVKEIGDRYRIKTVPNHEAAEGQSAAVKLGTQSAQPDVRAFMFLVGDQPYLSAAIINRLITVWRNNHDSIVAPVYNGRQGNPVIFPAQLKDRLLALQGDAGGRAVMETMRGRVITVAVRSSLMGIDIDTPEEYGHMSAHAGAVPVKGERLMP